jgi:abortive infection bacteriophage resistance protein
MKYTKAAFDTKQVLAKLQLQGFVINPPDELRALQLFDFVGSHRLKGYWYSSVDATTKVFKPGRENFTYLAQQVDFDHRLRALLWQLLEKVELAVRSVMANHLSLKHSPHWFLDREHFNSTRDWSFGQIVRKIEDEVGRARERRPVAHYNSKYTDPHMPPSWVVSECVTLGFWSRTFQALADPDDKRAISIRFGVNTPEVFESWLHCVTYIRNLVAHHGQILGVQLRIAPQNYKGVKGVSGKGGGKPGLSLHLGSDTKSLHAAVKMMNFIVNRTHLPNTIKADLLALFANYPPAFAHSVGFTAGWHTTAGW